MAAEKAFDFSVSFSERTDSLRRENLLLVLIQWYKRNIKVLYIHWARRSGADLFVIEAVGRWETYMSLKLYINDADKRGQLAKDENNGIDPLIVKNTYSISQDIKSSPKVIKSLEII